MTEAELRALVSAYISSSLEAGEDDRLHTTRGPYEIEAVSGAITDLLQSNASDLIFNKFDRIGGAVAALLEERGVALPAESPEYRKLCREILKAEQHVLRRELQAFDGVYDDYGHTATPTSNNQSTTESLLLSVACAKFMDVKVAEGQWSAKTADMVRWSLQVFLELVGDKSVREISKADLTEYWMAFCRLPNKFSKRFPGVPLRDLAQQEHDKLQKAATINKNTAWVKSLFHWLRKHDYVDGTPAEVIPVMKTDSAQDQRLDFTDDEVALIFGSTYMEDTADRPDRFWIPLLIAYSGARVEEIAQLHRDDVRHVEGIWCLDLNEEGEKDLKNAHTARLVPIHSKLIELGFLEYVAEFSAGHLWPNLRKTKTGYGDALGKWFNRRLRRLGITDERKVLYSFRHTVTTRLKRLDVQESTISELVGHKVEGMTMGRYGKRFQPQQLQAALERLKYPLDVCLQREAHAGTE